MLATAGLLLPPAAASCQAAPGDGRPRPGAAAAGSPSSSAEETPAATTPPAISGTPVRELTVRVLATYPHDPSAYTQGLELHDGRLFESAGQYGRSSLREVEPATGQVLRRRELAPSYFAEGLTLVPGAAGDPGEPDRLIQLTWQEGTAFVWRAADFVPLGERTYDGEGWGLCYQPEGPDGPRLVISDGSSYLTFRDPRSFAVTGGVAVTLGGRPAISLNELECVGGEIYANVYTTDTIYRIDAASGRVDAVIDASGLLTPDERAAGAEVLNGIAHDPADDTLLLTGKLWPKLFRVELVAR